METLKSTPFALAYAQQNSYLELLNSLTASYLLTDSIYPLLKTWKRTQGWALDRRILRWSRETLSSLQAKQLQAIVPVPQSHHRSWQLQGGTTLNLSRSLSRALSIPVLPLLEIVEKKSPAQAQLSREDRLSHAIRFRIRDHMRENWLRRGQGRILLVDDFWVTGHTLRAAARALQGGPETQIHGFCLGIKPLRQSAATQEEQPPAMTRANSAS